MRKSSAQWHVYRTRFLIKAKQLTAATAFVDVLGREHHGKVGDYLVESSDGTLRIAPKEIFEDVYVALEHGSKSWPQVKVAPKMDFPGASAFVSRPDGFRAVEKAGS
jgi:hypothetical protein